MRYGSKIFIRMPISRPDNKAFYLTAGVSYKYRFIRGSLVVADSHIASDKTREQTIVKASLSFDLPKVF